MVKAEWIWSLWQQRKCTAEQAIDALLQSRAKGSLQTLDNLKATALHLERMEEQQEVDRIQLLLSQSLKKFRPDPRVDKFLQQFSVENYGVLHRY